MGVLLLKCMIICFGPVSNLSVCMCRFKNVIFDIIPGEEGGTFLVKARFLGVDMERFPLKYQVITKKCTNAVHLNTSHLDCIKNRPVHTEHIMLCKSFCN